MLEEVAELRGRATIAKELVEKYTFWEGDGIWMVSGLPVNDSASSLPMFAVKQNNNGDTFICSPLQLHWLEARGRRVFANLPDSWSDVLDNEEGDDDRLEIGD